MKTIIESVERNIRSSHYSGLGFLRRRRKIIVDCLLVVAIGVLAVLSGYLSLKWRIIVWSPLVMYGIYQRGIRRILPGNFTCGVCGRDKVRKAKSVLKYSGSPVCLACVDRDPGLKQLIRMQRPSEDPKLANLLSNIGRTLDDIDYLRRTSGVKKGEIVLMADDPECVEGTRPQ